MISKLYEQFLLINGFDLFHDAIDSVAELNFKFRALENAAAVSQLAPLHARGTSIWLCMHSALVSRSEGGPAAQFRLPTGPSLEAAACTQN